jgi:hypothetical protein
MPDRRAQLDKQTQVQFVSPQVRPSAAPGDKRLIEPQGEAVSSVSLHRITETGGDGGARLRHIDFRSLI